MLLQKLHNKNYTRFNENNQLVFQLNFEKFWNFWNIDTRGCKRDINFMWLLNGSKAPDHSTISRFRKDYLSDSIEDLFYQLVEYLKQNNEIEYENLFVDGTKIEANANKYTFVWKKAVSKNVTKMYDIMPLLDNLSNRLNARYKNIIADSGYESEENYVYLENKGHTYYIKPQTYEKWKKKSFKNDISKRENMHYDSENDEYICHNEKFKSKINFNENKCHRI